MSTKTGSLSINSENIFPIIKKWLYSDHDIFVREMVSNGCDAITKLHKLSLIGEYEYPDNHKDSIHVIVNPDDKTLVFEDTGIGMTADEVEEYITQIAFSGATAFLEKYKDQSGKDEIIGHFGLGFYSAFMVADLVEIDTLSYQEGAAPVHWECDGSSEYTIGDGTKDTIGTRITLHLNEESVEFANKYRMQEVLSKYCSFMPVEIFLDQANAPEEYETIDESELKEDDTIVERIHEDAKTEEQEQEDGTKKTVEISPAKDQVKIKKRPVSLSDTHPLWAKHPNECSDEDYRSFYRKVFNDYKEPLFWIHLNMDYPFNLKGILYFPKINTEYDSIEGTIKLYNNQVFIADNIKEVIPEFLLLLKGVIDCPDLPLNVSRSALQNDGFVKKIADYITKKVADKLTGMCKTDRENYEKYWDDISPFIKYGCIRDEKFSEKMMDYILFKDIDGKYSTLKEMEEAKKAAAQGTEEAKSEGEAAEEAEAEKAEDADGAEPEKAEDADGAKAEKAEGDTEGKAEEKKETIYYVTDEVQQSQYINMFREAKQNAVILKHNIDTPFISHVERTHENLKFQRIDADLTDTFTDEETEETKKANTDALTEMFRKALDNDKLSVQAQKMKNPAISSMMTLSEESRRMQDMMKMYNMYGMDPSMFPQEETLVLNTGHPLVQYLLSHKDGEHVTLICKQLYDMAMLAHKQLSPEEMTAFISRSNEVLMLLAKE